MKSIVVIGSGNVATVFAKKLFARGFRIYQVWSRNIVKASILATEVNALATDKWGDIDEHQNIYLIAVNDAGIEDVANNVRLKNKLVFHTAGSVASDILACCSENYGVLYPLISVNKEVELPSDFPVFITSSNKLSEDLLVELAQNLSTKNQVISDENRFRIHLAAVFASNFSNHMFTLSNKILKDKNLEFEILKPLIFQSILQLNKFLPSEVQTGPALRNDINTLQKHVELLQSQPELLGLYLAISKNIQDYHYKRLM